MTKKLKKLLWLLSAAFCFGSLTSPAHALDVTVGCPGGGGGTYASITAALGALPPNGPNSITVTGTCNENVSISDMRSLTILGGAKIVQPQDSNTFDIARSQNITLVNLEIAGVPGSTAGSGGGGVSISEASDVQITRCDIHNNEGFGVSANHESVLSVINTNIHNNTPGDGLDVGGNSIADVRGTTIQNNGCAGFLGGACGIGVFVARNSVVSLRGHLQDGAPRNTLIENNGDIGILARLLSTVALDFGPPNPVTTVQGHNIVGIYIMEGAHLQVNGPSLIQGNGGGCPPQTPIPCGGIFASGNATLELNGFGTISGNHGAGIWVEQGTNLHLGGGVTVSNNTGDGVDIRKISIGDFTPIPASGSNTNTITGNGGTNIFCDARSLAVGNLSGFSKVSCGQQ
jgi:hypothetical protein